MYEGEKDRDPLETIRVSTEYLQSKKIFFCEEWHENNSALYSVSLNIPGTAFSVNGKGINRELALASAHGELQERLLNKALFRINTDTMYWISEENEGLESNPHLLLKKLGLSGEEIKNILKQCEFLSGQTQRIRDDVFTSVEGKKLIIPAQITDFLYGTNGMCAGNTFEEACTQGLSEILERYVAKRLFSEEIQTPNFDYEKLEKADYFRTLIHRLAKMKIAVCVKDFSLGIGLPVIGVIFSNQKNHTYFLKMGAHPNLNIALERCFTEFAQGRTDQQLQKMVSCEEIFFTENDRLLQYFTDGNTAFPISLLRDSGKSSLESLKSLSNKEYYDYLKRKIEILGFEIYLQDNSSDVFQAFRIIVPGMSEISQAERIPYAESVFITENKLKQFFEKKSTSTKELDEIVRYLEKNNGLNKEIGLYYPIVSVKMKGKRLPKFKMFELVNLEYLMKGDIKGSYQFLNKHLNFCKEDAVYLCLMLMENLVVESHFALQENDEIQNCVAMLFEADVRNAAYKLLTQPEELYEVECDIEKNYFFQNRRELYRKIYGNK